MGRAAKSKSKPKSEAPAPPPPPKTTQAAIQIAIGCALIITGFLITALTFKTATASGGKFVVAYGPVVVGFVLLARGALALQAPFDPSAPRQRDPRRWIYGGLAIAMSLVQWYCAVAIIPNRLPSAAVHLWSFPVLTFMMGVATLTGVRAGWWIAVFTGGGIMFSTMIVIVRILVSAGFLAGVYGAFGKAAATFSFMACVMIFFGVALIPMFHIRWLMSRRGKRAYGV